MNNSSPARIVRCPHCGKSSRFDSNNPDRPFCSPRCKTADIACWAEESYKIPAFEEDIQEESLRESRSSAYEDDDS